MSDVLTVPERSRAQRAAALERANVVRTHRAEAKRRMHRREVRLGEVLADPLFATAKVGDVLLACPAVGRVKRDDILRRAQISPSKTVGGMTGAQRERLELALRRFPSVGRVTMAAVEQECAA
jgi:hypothetical protein